MEKSEMEKLIPQIPAVGIVKSGDFGNSKFYKIVCGCGCDEHTIAMIVEAEDVGVTVEMFVECKTAWWNDYCEQVKWLPPDVKYFINRVINSISLINDAVFKGYVKLESYTILTRQQALNLSATLVSAIDDVEKFRIERKS